MKQFREEWKMSDEVVLTETTPLTFLGLELRRDPAGVHLGQWKFIDNLLEKYGMTDANPLTSVQMDAPGDEDILDLQRLRALQAYAGEFNWLATRTRGD